MGVLRNSDNYSKAQKARRAKQSPEELAEIGRRLAKARWSKTPKKKRSEFAKKIRNGNK